MLCVNPWTGAPATAAPPTENLGALRPSEDFSTLSLEAGKIGARCDKGLLLIGTPPLGFGRYVLPGNNFHIYDYPLFWANLRPAAEARAASFATPWLLRSNPAHFAFRLTTGEGSRALMSHANPSDSR